MRGDEKDLLGMTPGNDNVENSAELTKELFVNPNFCCSCLNRCSGALWSFETGIGDKEWPVGIKGGLLGRMDENLLDPAPLSNE